MLERTQGAVKLHDIDALALKHLIDYIYTGKITITEQNVQVLLPASSLLQMHSVREACCCFLLRQLHPSNCLGIRSFAGKILNIIKKILILQIFYFPFCRCTFM